MLLDAAALLLLGIGIGCEAHRLGALKGAVSIAAAIALIVLWRESGEPRGFGVTALLGYALARALSALTAGEMSAAPLLAGFSAGLLTYCGPFGVLAASSAIAGYGLLDAGPSRGRSLVAAAVLLFMPLTVLAAFAAAALIETGLMRSIEAGPGIFLRGAPPGPAALLLCAPLLLPLGLAALPRFRNDAIGPLAVGMAGLIAGLALDSVASFWPFAVAASLAAARGGAARLVIAGLLSLTGFWVPAFREANAVPSVAPWRIAADIPEILPGWGTAAAYAAAHPAEMPSLEERDGHYVLIPAKNRP